MGALYAGGVCCLCISIWGVIQLTLMGFFYSIEACTLIEDVKAEKYTDITDFLKKTKNNYQTVSKECYYCAYMYLAMIFASLAMITVGKKKDKIKAQLAQDEDIICGTLAKPKQI